MTLADIKLIFHDSSRWRYSADMNLKDGYTQSLSLHSSVRLAYGLLPLMSFASRYPIDLDTALEQARIDRFGLMDPAYTISLDQELSLLSHVIRKLPDASLSLQLAQQYRLRGFSVLGLAMQASASPLAMLQLIMRYPRLAWGQFDGVLQSDGEWLKIQFHSNPRLGDSEAFLLERDIACAFVLFEEALGKRVKVQSLSFQHACKNSPAQYLAFFGCAVEFSSTHNQLVCAVQELLQPLPQADVSMCEFYTAQCERMSQGMERNFHYGEAVTARLQTSPKILNLQQLASAMLMTPRTLQRRLSAEGLSFTRLLCDVRQQRAQQLLQNPAIGLQEIATQLGFSDAVAFSHAFKSWFACSPQAWRRGQIRPA